jgi:hypothetical protein
MDQSTYQRWWPLHLRVARGETLAAEDQSFYDAQCKELDKAEILQVDQEAFRAAQASLAALKAETARLQERSRQLDAEIEALQAALSKQKRQLLGVED